jgi:outer membrane protein assembly factor BamB
MFKHQEKLLLLLALFMLLSLVGCGTNSVTATQQSGFTTIPTGKGSDPEPGTDGLARPRPEGHQESILSANGITYVGSDNGQLYAFDARNGKLHWQIRQSVNYLRALANGIIYTLDRASSNTLYALNAADGAILWRYTRAQDINSVHVVDSTIYLNTGNSAYPVSIDALNASSGALLWQYKSNIPLDFDIRNNHIYLVPQQDGRDSSLTDQVVTVLDANSGRILWHLTISVQDGFTRGGILEDNGVTYIVTNQGSLYALSAATGQVRWHTSQPADENGPGKEELNASTPVFRNGVVYAGSVNNLFAYRASDGRQLWKYHSLVVSGPPLSMQPFVENGMVYFETRPPAGMLVALKASDGTVVWQRQQESGAPDGLAFVAGLLIDQVGDITAWRASDGSKVWKHNTDNGEGPPGPGSPVVISGGVIYVGGSNGLLLALRVSDGQQLWQYQIAELPVQEPPVYSASVTFKSSTPYDSAIQLVSDLGLKTFAECRFTWVAQDDRDLYASAHVLTVAANTNSAPLWLERLQAMPEITQVQSDDGPRSCPNNPINAQSVQRLPENQAGTYVQVSFVSGPAYLKAWESLNALGFRVADPCYEQARAQGHKPAWHSMSQEESFAQKHNLVLATTPFNAITWRQQLQNLVDNGQIEILSTAKLFC